MEQPARHRKRDSSAMAEMRALMREDDDTASTGSEEPDAEDRATVTTVTIGDLDIVTQEATHAFGASGADQSGNVVWGAARVLAERIGGERFAGATVVELGCGCAVPAVVIGPTVPATARSPAYE